MGTRVAYATKPRELIAHVLRRERRFLTAAEIHQLLGTSGARVSLSTVYRTLGHLQTKNEVTPRVDPDGEAAYMACEEPARHHHHAICTSCGRVENVDCAALEQFADSLRTHNGFELENHAMEFFGRCNTCR